MRAIVTHRGPTTGGRGGGGTQREIWLCPDLRPAGGPMTGGGVSKRRTNTRQPDRALKNRTVWPKAGRMAKIRGYSPECPGGLTTSMLTGNS